jgi:hypothetical protein
MCVLPHVEEEHGMGADGFHHAGEDVRLKVAEILY